MKNVSLEEVKKFDQISSKWWDPQGPFKPLHDINPLRLKFILDTLNTSSLRGKSVLDVGCGGGILSESLAKTGADVTGIDCGQDVIKSAIHHAKTNQLQINYFNTTIEQFLSTTAFDVIVCMELLEHVPDPASIISACARLVKPNGVVFFSTLNRSLKSFLFAIVGAEYILKLLPAGTHDYAKFIRPSELQKMALQAGLSIDSIQGITYHPLFREYRLSDDVSVNYLVSCAIAK